MACVQQGASDVVLTPELQAIVSTDVAAGETLKVEAAAGSGKSTALRLCLQRRRDRHVLYLTFTKAEAKAKQADYARRGLDHVIISTLHARAFATTEDLHGHQVEAGRRVIEVSGCRRSAPHLNQRCGMDGCSTRGARQ